MLLIDWPRGRAAACDLLTSGMPGIVIVCVGFYVPSMCYLNCLHCI